MNVWIGQECAGWLNRKTEYIKLLRIDKNRKSLIHCHIHPMKISNETASALRQLKRQSYLP